MIRTRTLTAVAVTAALFVWTQRMKANEPVAKSDSVLEARPLELQNATLVELRSTRVAVPESADQSTQQSTHGHKKFWVALTPLLVAAAYFLIIYLATPST